MDSTDRTTNCSNASHNNCSAFYTKIKECFVTGKLTDVNVKCDNKVFKCHRIALIAASEYFDKMFTGSFVEGQAKDVVIRNIDSDTFGEILHFMYTGNIHIVDQNVFYLLLASEILQVEYIERECIRHLMERSIPMEDALEIFLFVCATQKTSMIPTISRFVLEHLSRLSKNRVFVDMPFQELNTLFSYFRPSSARRERALLKAGLRWSRAHSDCKTSFVTLAHSIQFQHLSADHINEYLRENFNDLPAPSILLDTDSDPEKMDEVSLHVFINTRIDSDMENRIKLPRSNVFTLQKYDDNMDWCRRHVTVPVIDQMRTTVLDDQIYCLKSQQEQFTFSAASSVDFSERKLQPLTPPFDLNWSGQRSSYSLCCDTNNIYLSTPFDHQHFLAYNHDLDRWSSLSHVIPYEEAVPIMMTCFDRRLYIVDKIGNLVAYDQRVGKLEHLSTCGIFHGAPDECCTHKEKIYVSGVSHVSEYYEENKIGMEVYIPVAGKWDMTESSVEKVGTVVDSHRLTSFDNKLWMFCSDPVQNDGIYIQVQTYDAFSREWSWSNSLNNAIQEQIHSSRYDSYLYTTVADVVVSK